MANAPIGKVTVGSVDLPVWENTDENKRIWHSVTIQRHYKSNGAWKNTNHFRLSDLVRPPANHDRLERAAPLFCQAPRFDDVSGGVRTGYTKH
jgi:hypothetical protein